MPEKEQFYKLHCASLDMFTKKRFLVNCFLGDQGVRRNTAEILKHLDHLPIYYLFRKLHYFQGTTFCILAETELT